MVRLRFNTKELAMTSILSSLWIVSEVYLGPVISQITNVHGVIQRTVGWLLMLLLAALTGRFGRVTAMAAMASAATRILRPGRLYALFVGFGYALGGLTFDLLYFLPVAKNFEGRARKAYLLGISTISGTVAIVPYLLFNFSVLGVYGFVLWIPLYTYDVVKGVALSISGTLIGLSILPKIEVWSLKVNQN